jgi:hypothetical protein
MNLEELIDNYYAPKKGNELLIQLIEARLNERDLSIPKIFVTSPVDIESGKLGTEANKEYLELLKNIKGGSPYIWQRLQKVNTFLKEPKKIIKNASVKKAFSSFLLIQEIKENLERLEPSMAGFQAETIIAQLMDGSKEANNGAVDVESQEFGGFQIKTLVEKDLQKKDSKDPAVGGSFTQIIDFYQRRKEEYNYIIILKSRTKGIYYFYTFALSFQDFLDKFELTNYKREFRGYVPPERFAQEKDAKKTFQEFIEVLGNYFNPNNNNIFVPALIPTTSTTPEDLLNRFNILKFLEKKRRLIQGNEYYNLDTTYSIKQSYISQIFKNRNTPGPGTTFLGELDLRDEVLKNLREEYKRSLTGKMFEVLDSLKDSVQSMNRYFATSEPYIANETVGNLNNTTNKFSNYFLKKEDV